MNLRGSLPTLWGGHKSPCESDGARRVAVPGSTLLSLFVIFVVYLIFFGFLTVSICLLFLLLFTSFLNLFISVFI